MGRPKAEIQKKQLGVRIDLDTIKKIKHLAIEKGVPLNTIVEEALMDVLKKYKQK
jgi:predicted HicB family RNase H-like nuclease